MPNINLNRRFIEAAKLTGLPASTLAYRVLSEAAGRIEEVTRNALNDHGLRDERELMIRADERETRAMEKRVRDKLEAQHRENATHLTPQGNMTARASVRGNMLSEIPYRMAELGENPGFDMVLANLLTSDATPRNQLAEDYRETYYHKFDANPDPRLEDDQILHWHDLADASFTDLQGSGDGEPEENRDGFVTAYVLTLMAGPNPYSPE